MSELVRNFFTWYGLASACVAVIFFICRFVGYVIDRVKGQVVKSVVESLRIERSGLPDASRIPDHNVLMTLSGVWLTVNIEDYIEAYLKEKELITVNIEDYIAYLKEKELIKEEKE